MILTIARKVDICHQNSSDYYWIFLKFSKNFDRNSSRKTLSYSWVRAQRFMSTTCENSLLVIFFFISICWGASPTKIKQLAHLVGCIISTVLISQQYVKFLIRNPAYQNRIAQWSGKLLSRQHLCTGSSWFSMPFFQEIKSINSLKLVDYYKNK